MSNVGDAFKKAGTNVALGVADTVGVSRQNCVVCIKYSCWTN